MRRTVENIKTAIIVFLVFSMLFLWMKNMQLHFPSESGSQTLLDSSFWIFNDSTDTHTEITADDSYFSPVSITLITNKTALTSATNKPLTSTLWDNYKPLAAEVFSSAYTCVPSTLDEWKSALTGNDLVLIDFPSEIPYPTICAFLNKTSGFSQGDLCSVKTLLLHSDSGNRVSAMAYDGSGNVFSFTTEDPASSMIYDFNSNNLTAYTVNKGFISSMLALNSQSTAARRLPPHHPILTQAPTLTALDITNPISDLFDSDYSGNITSLALISNPTVISLLENFNMNPSTVGVYTDAAARLIFINSDSRLVIDRKGAIDYAVSRESTAQILTASLLESERSQFSSFEQVSAATSFLNLFKDTFIGEGSDLLLDGIKYTNGKTEYTFKYYKNLCKLSCDDLDAEIRLTFDSDGLVEARIIPLVINDSSENATSEQFIGINVSESTALVLSSLTHDSLSDFRPIYHCQSFNVSAVPVWAAVTERS